MNHDGGNSEYTNLFSNTHPSVPSQEAIHLPQSLLKEGDRQCNSFRFGLFIKW